MRTRRVPKGEYYKPEAPKSWRVAFDRLSAAGTYEGEYYRVLRNLDEPEVREAIAQAVE